MDIQRTDAKRRKAIRIAVFLTTLTLAVGGIGYGVSRLKPAAPPVDFSALWPDTVKRGPLVREVRGIGALVPEDTMLITATTDARVERILIRPGTPVRADSLVMILGSPELDNQLLTAEYAVKTAEADYTKLEVALQASLLDMQSKVTQVNSDYNTAKLQADRDARLMKDGLVSEIDAKISATRAQQLLEQLAIEKRRVEISAKSDEASLAAARVRVDQLRADYNLKKSQVERLRVRAGFDGMLESLPSPLTPVEEGQRVAAGAPLGKVAQNSRLKAELKIPETQVKDIAIGQSAVIDTRLAGGGSNGLIDGTVSRIEQSIVGGTVTVDVALKGALPQGARPDLSVDGTVQLERLNDVLQVGCPVYGQENAAVQLFKIEPDGKYANKVKVTFGRRSVSYIEVKSGLNAGDRVILSDMSAYDSYERIKLN
ncbi:MAG TPA: HlyD family efflux transporter periplasmic adaptor subunit [Bryobacteraceae bacterium]|nr:HlyD family efflux transporter periplasmic adaptor subunit [Bryobacteraceae bacterium]